MRKKNEEILLTIQMINIEKQPKKKCSLIKDIISVPTSNYVFDVQLLNCILPDDMNALIDYVYPLYYSCNQNCLVISTNNL